MKKFTLLMACFFVAYMAEAQQQDTNDYNHWSIEVNGSANKALRTLTPGYSNPTLNLKNGNWSGDVGVRYMINDLFGFKASFGYNKLKAADGSSPFETKYYRYDLEGVINAGTLLGFREWTQRLNFLVHGGAGLGHMKTGSSALYSDEKDDMLNVMVGITPQLRLASWLALNADLTAIGNARQKYNWDGNGKTSSSLDGILMNASVGLTFYLGGAPKHADWVDTGSMRGDVADSLRNRITEIETKMQDSDQDGVPDYLDREPNTTNGVTVDTKGRAVDKNNNGIPDEIEEGLRNHYVTRDEFDEQDGSDLIKSLIDDGYTNVYFKFDSDVPETYSLGAINYLIRYMKDNTSKNANLIGYADELGNAEYNQKLSEKRAKKVYDILVSSGIDESRLDYEGNGIDDSVDKDSSAARQLVRRVTFKLK